MSNKREVASPLRSDETYLAPAYWGGHFFYDHAVGEPVTFADLQKVMTGLTREAFNPSPAVEFTYQIKIPSGHHFSEIADHQSPGIVDELLVERERLKTQLISMHRQLLELQARVEESNRQVARLEKQNDGQLSCIGEIIKANNVLQKAVLEQHEQSLCMHNITHGVVTKRLEDGVAVEFEAVGEYFEQVYNDSQFMRGKTPSEGDRIEAHVFMWHRQHKQMGIDAYLTSDEIQNGFSGYTEGIDHARKRK
ncbi:MAG TPA: hypothetical protein VFE58_17290 [Tepidisphaeraceae bacterium]|jgi:hypothetical protein|nr:hypothetical protein [Tepidisphaeraceae bacterium]